MRLTYTHTLVSRARELRRNQTPAERKLWFDFLRSHTIKFRRQMPCGGYILDFYAPAVRLCVEVDGFSHDIEEAQEYDAVRTRTLEALGVHVLRFTNAEIMNNFAGVCSSIDATCSY